jgi:transmembrane protein EpsG
MILVLFFANVADRKSSKFCLLLSATVLSLFCGLRAVNTGVDTIHYYNFLSYIRGSGISFGSDIGFSVISYFLMGFFNNPYYPLVIFAVVTNFLMVFRLWDFRKEASLPLMLLIYMAIHYPYTFNIVRQFLAISIIFWGTRYIERGEYAKYVILNILASTIHTSSLLCFSFLFVTFGYQSEKKKHKILGFGAATVFILAGLFLFNTNITKYENYFTTSSVGLHTMTIFKILCVLMIMIANKVFWNDKFSIDKFGNYVPMQRQIPIMYMAGLLLSALGMWFTFMNRIGFYFIMFEMPFWGQAVKATVNRRIYQLIIVLIVGYVLVINFTSAQSADNLFYYHSFLAE